LTPIDLLQSYEITKDMPSVWCNFSLIQAFLFPFLFKRLRTQYIPENSPILFTIKDAAKLGTRALAIVLIANYLFPFIILSAGKLIVN
jgi:NADH:ubiquinone oxidoreductase subunit 6 (subunit J)